MSKSTGLNRIASLITLIGVAISFAILYIVMDEFGLTLNAAKGSLAALAVFALFFAIAWIIKGFAE